MLCADPHSRNLRKARYSQPGLYYFLTTSVSGRRPIFVDEDNATIVLNSIQWLRSAGRFLVDAAVVMPDHLHVVGELGESTLSQVMHSLKSFSARQLVTAGVAPPVWQDGYHDHGLRNDEDYRLKIRYVLQNPVRAGLVQQVHEYPYLILPEWWKEDVENW